MLNPAPAQQEPKLRADGQSRFDGRGVRGYRRFLLRDGKEGAGCFVQRLRRARADGGRLLPRLVAHRDGGEYHGDDLAAAGREPGEQRRLPRLSVGPVGARREPVGGHGHEFRQRVQRGLGRGERLDLDDGHRHHQRVLRERRPAEA